MKVFITGASGYIGGSVAKYLVDAGHEVTGLIRDPAKRDALQALGIRPVLGTLDDAYILTREAQAARVAVQGGDLSRLEIVDRVRATGEDA